MPTPTIRTARQADAPACAQVMYDCWESSYRGLLPADLVDAMSLERSLEMWTRALADPRNAVFIAEAASSRPGSVLGVASARLEDDAVGYIPSLYVSPAGQGRGVGRALLWHAERHLARAGAARGTLWVFEENLPSRAFYRRCGWEPDGRRLILPEWGRPQIGFGKALGPETATAQR